MMFSKQNFMMRPVCWTQCKHPWSKYSYNRLFCVT